MKRGLFSINRPPILFILEGSHQVREVTSKEEKLLPSEVSHSLSLSPSQTKTSLSKRKALKTKPFFVKEKKDI